MENYNVRVFKNSIWRFMERVGSQGISFIVSIILARILSPNDYGLLAIVIVFISIFQVFIDNSLGSALVQKDGADDLDFSSIFYANLFLSMILYFFLFFLSPLISKIYNNILLTKALRIAGLLIIIFSVKNIQQCYISKKIQFKKFFFSTLIGTIISAFVGIYLALKGYGIWALIVQLLTNNIIDTIVLWFTSGWKPKLVFSFERVRLLLPVGISIFITNFIRNIYEVIKKLIIGKKYTPSDLAYYLKSDQWSYIFSINISQSVDEVMFPSLSNVQNDIDVFKSMAKRTLKITCYIIFPLSCLLFSTANNIILCLYTEKWAKCIPLLKILCISQMFYPIYTFTANVIKSRGNTKDIFKFEFYYKIISILLLLVALPFGLTIVAYSQLFSNIIVVVISMIYLEKYINYNFTKFFMDISKTLFLCLILVLTVYCIDYLKINLYFKTFIQIICGISIFVIGSIVLRIDSFNYIKQLFLKLLIK